MKNLRCMEILAYLKKKKHCSVTELQEVFHVSAATLYRDLTDLASRNAIRKVHGGAIYPDVPEPGKERYPVQQVSFQERTGWNRQKKNAVAARAMERICNGDILFLDSSTTVSCLAELLEKSVFSSLTIVTNSVSIIRNFGSFPSHYVLISLGGSYDLQLNSFLGQTAIRELEQLSISKAFISAFGVCDGVVTTNHERHAGLLHRVLDMAPRKYLLVDRSKFNRTGLFKVAPLRAFDEVLSD